MANIVIRSEFRKTIKEGINCVVYRYIFWFVDKPNRPPYIITLLLRILMRLCYYGR